MDLILFLGFTAGALTTVAFLPQVIKTCKTKSTKDISLGMFFTLVIGIILWVVYGIITKDLPLIIANTTTLVLTMIILSYKIRYK